MVKTKSQTRRKPRHKIIGKSHSQRKNRGDYGNSMPKESISKIVPSCKPQSLSSDISKEQEIDCLCCRGVCNCEYACSHNHDFCEEDDISKEQELPVTICPLKDISKEQEIPREKVLGIYIQEALNILKDKKELNLGISLMNWSREKGYKQGRKDTIEEFSEKLKEEMKLTQFEYNRGHSLRNIFENINKRIDKIKKEMIEK